MGVFQASSMTLGIVDNIKNFFVNIGNALNGMIGRIIYNVLICGVGRIADLCQLIFRKFAGISSSGVKVDGKQTNGDIVISFLESSVVRNLFFALLILAVVILLITTFAAVIRTEFAKDGNNNKKKVIKNAFRGLANFLFVPVVCIFSLLLGNVVLRALDGALSTDSSQYISSQIFIAGAYNANRARNSQIDEEVNRYASGSFGALLAGTSGTDSNGYGNFGIFLDDTMGTNQRRAADKIDNCFTNKYAYRVGIGLVSSTEYQPSNTTSKIDTDFINSQDSASENSRTIDYRITDFWYDGYCLDAVNVDYVNSENSDSKASVKSKITFVDGELVNFSYYNVGLVYYYYDLSLTGFNYLIGGIAMIFSAWTLLLCVLALIKRIFMLTTLFVISAPICAIYPLDDGKALGDWRKEFIKEVLAAYSVVIVMNLFLSLLPVMSDISVFVSGELGILTDFANYFARVIIILGGLTFFKGASKTIAGIIGAGDAVGDSDNAKGAFKSNVGRVAGTGVAVAGLGAGIGKAAGKAFGNLKGKISESKDKSFEKKYGADIVAQSEAQQNAGGKAENPINPIGDGSNSMGTTSNTTSSNVSSSNSMNTTADNSSGKATNMSKIPTLQDGSVDWRSARLQFKAQNKVEKKQDAGKHVSKRLQSKADDYQKYAKDKQDRKDHRKEVMAKIKSTTSSIIQPFEGTTSSVAHNMLKGDWKVKDSFNSYKGTKKYQENQKKAKEKAAEKSAQLEQKNKDKAEQEFRKNQLDELKNLNQQISDMKNKKD